MKRMNLGNNLTDSCMESIPSFIRGAASQDDGLPRALSPYKVVKQLFRRSDGEKKDGFIPGPSRTQSYCLVRPLELRIPVVASQRDWQSG